MNGIIEFLREYVGLFLIFTVVLYVIPSEQYRGYLRFFLEMVLVMFCLQQFLTLGKGDAEKNWEKAYQSFYDEMERRRTEAEEMEYLDMEYVYGFAEEGRTQDQP